MLAAVRRASLRELEKPVLLVQERHQTEPGPSWQDDIRQKTRGWVSGAKLAYARLMRN